MNYFKIPAISASLLSRLEWIYKNNLSLDLLKTKPKSEAMDLGSFIHKSVELGNTTWYTTLDYELLDKLALKDFERKLVLKGLTVDNYCDIYTNKITKAYQAGDLDAIDQINNILEDLRNKAKEWVEYRESIDKPVLDESFSNPVEADYKIVRCYDALAPVIERFGSLEKEKVIEWEYRGYKCKSMIDLSSDKYLIDVKTHSNGIVKNIRKYNYIRQLAFYNEALPAEQVFIIAVNTEYFNAEVIKISLHDLEAGKYGGIFKPSWMTIGKNYFTTFGQKEKMYNLGFWDRSYDEEIWSYGFDQLFNLIEKNNWNENIINAYTAD